MNERGPVNERTTKGRARVSGHSECPPRRRAARVASPVAFLVASGALLFPASANAQEWLKDRMYQEGQGVRTGDFEWHPGIAVEGGYDSNYFLRSDKTGVVNGSPGAPVMGSPEMRVTPSLSLASVGPRRSEGEASSPPPPLSFRLNASGTYQEFFGQLSPDQRNFSINTNARLNILPDRPFGG